MQNRTVFDTNIWVSYFIKGKFGELIDLIVDKDVRNGEFATPVKILNLAEFKKQIA